MWDPCLKLTTAAMSLQAEGGKTIPPPRNGALAGRLGAEVMPCFSSQTEAL